MSVSVKQLVSAMKEASLTPNTASKKRNAKRRQKRKAAVAATAVPGTSSAVRVNSVRPMQWSMNHREYLGQLKVGSDGTVQGSFFLSPQVFPWLGGIAKAFEKYMWVSLALEYIPDVGTQQDGSVALGIDWGASSAPTFSLSKHSLGRETLVGAAYTRASVLAMTPSLVTPLWRPVTFTVPANVLQTRRWYSVPKGDVSAGWDDYGPGFLAYYATGPKDKVVGDIWATYRLVFAGTRAI